jgi:aspartyl-tRNA(Asn)/glutamyl-tRNA(Gln) amidotransferase subunit A
MTTGDSLADLSATDLLGRFAAGSTTPIDAVRACIDRIEALEPVLNAVITLAGSAALDAARDSTARWAAGTARPLEGIPIGLKDIVATAGIRTTGGSALYHDHAPDETASHAKRLIDAGAILLAKLGTFEFACGGAANGAFGPVANPWDPARTTGGSSSGSGAAVASGMVPMAVGTDTGGSIRIPAAYCGITGLKPTYGRVPRHGVMGLSWTLDHVGPMTRSVEDAALMLGVMAGHDPRDSSSSAQSVPDYRAALDRPVDGLRLARLRGWFEEPMHPAVASAYEAAVDELTELGIEIVDVELDDLEALASAAWTICFAEMLSLHELHLPTIADRDAMGAGLLGAAPFVSACDYLRALRWRRTFQSRIIDALAGAVAFVLPGATTAPPRLDDMLVDTGDDRVDWLQVATRNHIPFNYTGLPALCIPCGLAEGMPVSMQLVGRPHDESTLLALGAHYQRRTTHHLARPPILGGGPS